MNSPLLQAYIFKEIKSPCFPASVALLLFFATQRMPLLIKSRNEHLIAGGVVGSGAGVLEQECCSRQRCQGSSRALPGRAAFLSTGSTSVLRAGGKLPVKRTKDNPACTNTISHPTKQRVLRKKRQQTKDVFSFYFPIPVWSTEPCLPLPPALLPAAPVAGWVGMLCPAMPGHPSSTPLCWAHHVSLF